MEKLDVLRLICAVDFFVWVCYNKLSLEEVLNMFYWFTFADGYRECARGYDRSERLALERAHGKIVSKTRA